MTIRILLYLFSILLLSACTNEKTFNLDDVQTIELKNTKDVLPISSFVESIDYLELKFPGKRFEIKEILDIKSINGDLLIKERRSKEITLLRFSQDGIFKNKIENTTAPRDISAFKNEYLVWDENSVKSYSKEGGFVKKMFDYHGAGNRLLYARNSIFLFNETSPAFISKYSVEGKLQEYIQQGSAETTLKPVNYSSIIQAKKNTYHFFSPHKDTVFALSGNKWLPKYIFNGGNFPTYQQVLKSTAELDDNEKLKYLHNNRHVIIKKYLENKQYIFIAYWFGSSANYVLIDKSTWESTYFSLGINDVDGGIWDMPFYLSDDNYLYVPINPYRINSHKILNKINKDFEKYREQFQANGNRVIMLCKLK